MTCRRCNDAPARVPFGAAEFCIPCAVRVAVDTPVVVLAGGCVVCHELPADVVDGATGNRYCSADAATFLATIEMLRAVDRALAS